MAKTPHAIDRVLSLALQPWALTPPMMRTIAGILGHRLAGERLDTSALEVRPPAAAATAAGVAVIPIHGVIAPRITALDDISGGASFEQAGLALAEAMARPDVGTIVLDFDSPGGSVLGAREFAHQVLAARTKKRILAQANYEMCSAAYWVGSCASEIIAAPSAMVGSLGVYTIHEDLSVMLQQLGVQLTYIYAGKFKVDGNEAEPLSASARDRLQALVDAKYAFFMADVAAGRGVTEEQVRAGFGQGSVVTADEALALRMIDSIGTLDDTMARVLPDRAPAPALAARSMPAVLATPQEPAKATGQERARQQRDVAEALMALGF